MTATSAAQVLKHIRELAGGDDFGRLTAPELLERFTRDRDPAAFEALLRRYGPLVLGVCRRVLANRQDAEDAFQATFLILAQQVESIRKREALASWLYGVAYRVAVRSRARSRRRQKYEARGGGSRLWCCRCPIEVRPCLNNDNCRGKSWPRPADS